MTRSSSIAGLALALGCMLSPFCVWAQGDAPAIPTETQTWLGLSTAFWLHKDWNADLQVQLRNDGDGLRYRQVFAEGQLEYELSKHGRLAGEYRFGQRRDEGLQHRVALGLGTRFWKSGDWELKGRSKAQSAWSKQDPADLAWRNKLQLSRKLNKRWDLQAEAELWTGIWPYLAAADQTRLGLEASWDRKDHDIALGYAYGRSLGMQEPRSEHILSLRYRFGSIRVPLFRSRDAN